MSKAWDHEIDEHLESVYSELHALKSELNRKTVTIILCQLCLNDVVGAERHLENYKSTVPSFEETADCKFIVNVIKAFTAYDLLEFKQHCKANDEVHKLDQFQLHLLLNIQNIIEECHDSSV